MAKVATPSGTSPAFKWGAAGGLSEAAVGLQKPKGKQSTVGGEAATIVSDSMLSLASTAASAMQDSATMREEASEDWSVYSTWSMTASVQVAGHERLPATKEEEELHDCAHEFSTFSAHKMLRCSDCNDRIRTGTPYLQCDHCSTALCWSCHQALEVEMECYLFDMDLDGPRQSVRRGSHGSAASRRNASASDGDGAEAFAEAVLPQVQRESSEDEGAWCPGGRLHNFRAGRAARPLECSRCDQLVNVDRPLYFCSQCTYDICDPCHECNDKVATLTCQLHKQITFIESFGLRSWTLDRPDARQMPEASTPLGGIDEDEDDLDMAAGDGSPTSARLLCVAHHSSSSRWKGVGSSPGNRRAAAEAAATAEAAAPEIASEAEKRERVYSNQSQMMQSLSSYIV